MTLSKKIQNYINTQNNPYSEKVTLPKTIDSKSITFQTISNKPTILFIPFAFTIAMLCFQASNSDSDKAFRRRTEELQKDYTEIIVKLLLFHSAGLTVRNAFIAILTDAKKRTQNSSLRYAYLEIEHLLNKMNSGIPEAGSYAAFGKRCQLHIYIKLGTLLEQNLQKGSHDLQDALKQEMKEHFSLQQNQTLQFGSKAGTKMLFPMILILAVIMMIIIIPAFLSMNTL